MRQFKKVQVGKLRPNPHRDWEKYPLQQPKLDKLQSSFEATGFWGNILCREVEGGYEIAFGHHRLETLKRWKGENQKVDVIVDDISEANMVKMMAFENSLEFGNSIWIEMENIRAAVRALADGKLDGEWPELPEGVNAKHLCLAPSVLPAGRSLPNVGAGQSIVQPIYSRVQVAQFMDMTRDGGKKPDYPFEVAWEALVLIEQGYATESHFKSLSRDQANSTIASAKKVRASHERRAKVSAQDAAAKRKEAEEKTGRAKAKAEAEAELLEEQAKAEEKAAKSETKRTVKEVTTKLTDGEMSVREAREEGTLRAAGAPQQQYMDLDKFCEKAANKVTKVLADETYFGKQGEYALLKKHRADANVDELIDALQGLKKRCDRFISQLKP